MNSWSSEKRGSHFKMGKNIKKKTEKINETTNGLHIIWLLSQRSFLLFQVVYSKGISQKCTECLECTDIILAQTTRC